jgi:hypothetical protein
MDVKTRERPGQGGEGDALDQHSSLLLGPVHARAITVLICVACENVWIAIKGNCSANVPATTGSARQGQRVAGQTPMRTT